MRTGGMVLLVIDMLQDYFERQPQLAVQRDRLVASLNDLTRRLRRYDQSIIWVRQEFHPDLTDAFLDMRRDGIRITIAGTPGCQILPDLVRMPAETEIVKKRYSAFFGTALTSTLEGLAPSAVIVAGINTHACVRMTVVDAFQRDYDVIVATECVGSYDGAHHDVTLQYLGGRMARLLTNPEIEALITSRAV